MISARRRGLTALAKMAVSAGLCMALAACYEVAPRQVEAHVSIQRDGRFDITYSGQFGDISEFMNELDRPGEKKTDPLAVERHAQETLAKSSHLVELKRMRPHVFFARWHQSGRFGDDERTGLLAWDWLQEIPRLVRYDRLTDLEEGFDLQDLVADESEKMERTREGPPSVAVERMLKAFSGRLVVDIDADLVGESNASAHHLLDDGRTRYEWSLRLPSQDRIKFSFFFGKGDAARFKLSHAEWGADCRELIGETCKCGPFRMANYGIDTPMVHVPYEIEAGGKTLRGCSDANGFTGSLEMERLGSCQLRAIRDENVDECPTVKAGASASSGVH